MSRLLRIACPVLLAFGCSRPAEPTSAPPAPGPVTAPPVGKPDVVPPAPTPAPNPTPTPTPKRAEPPAADQSKLREELGTLGVAVDGTYEVRVTAKALTDAGEFKPGVAEKLAKLESASKLMAIDLPAFAASAGKAVAKIPGLKRVDMWRTKADEEAIAAFGACPELEVLDLNNGSGEHPVVTDKALAGLAGLRNVTVLRCDRGKITGAGLAAIAEWTKLDELTLAGCPIDDAGMPHLVKLTNLRELNLNGSKITGGLEALKDYSRLFRLALGDTAVTDAGVKALAGLPKLGSIDLGRTKVTDVGVAVLAGLPELRRLDVCGTAMTDIGAVALSKAQTLVIVWLDDTKVTDVGVIALAGLPQLRSLMARLPLTDASLEALAKSPELVELYLFSPKFTEAGLKKFKEARPKVRIN